MVETLVQWFVTNLGGRVTKEAIIFLVSMVPILELRGGLLAASPALLNVPMWTAIPLCVVGNIILLCCLYFGLSHRFSTG